MFSTILLQLIILFLPTQLGLHFWPDFSRAAGIKVDYLSPTLYFLDILISIYILINIKIVLSWLRTHMSGLILVLVFMLINTAIAISPLNTLVWWIHLLLYLSFFLVFRLKKISWIDIRNPLLVSTIMVVFIEVGQAIYQHSLDGLFYWLGERSFSTTTSGLGRLNLFGLDFVRPQSTFSHPNSLAGYLLVVYYLLHKNKSPLWQRVVVFVGLLLTLSKASLLAFLLVIILGIKTTHLIYGSVIFSILQLVLPGITTKYQFLADRLFLLTPTRKIMSNHPLLGVGLGSFIPALAQNLNGSFLIPAKLQPVHNLILLCVSELGILGSLILSVAVGKNIRKHLNPAILGLIAIVLITGSFDHYWWTLIQNKLILLLAIGILL